MEITEKVAYLKGLAEGMALDTGKKEGKLLSAIIDILDDIALELEDMKDEQTELEAGLDAVSEDLEDVEDIVYDCDIDYDAYDEDDEDEDEEDDDSEDCYATTCPNCNETIYFDESILDDGGVVCPKCGEKLAFDTEDIDEVEAAEEEEKED